jgi:hypothetical protein
MHAENVSVLVPAGASESPCFESAKANPDFNPETGFLPEKYRKRSFGLSAFWSFGHIINLIIKTEGPEDQETKGLRDQRTFI